MEKKALIFKPTIKSQSCLGSVSNGFSATQLIEVSLNGDVCYF